MKILYYKNPLLALRPHQSFTYKLFVLSLVHSCLLSFSVTEIALPQQNSDLRLKKVGG